MKKLSLQFALSLIGVTLLLVFVVNPLWEKYHPNPEQVYGQFSAVMAPAEPPYQRKFQYRLEADLYADKSWVPGTVITAWGDITVVLVLEDGTEYVINPAPIETLIPNLTPDVLFKAQIKNPLGGFWSVTNDTIPGMLYFGGGQ